MGANAFLWEFGDGTTSTLESPTHTYSFQGTFEIKLIAIDNTCNSTDTVIQQVTFKNPPDQTDFLINQDVCNPLKDIELIQLGSGFQYHTWDMGNGDTLVGSNATYLYQEPGLLYHYIIEL